MSEWISVEERLPEEGVSVLAVSESGWMCTCRKSVIESHIKAGAYTDNGYRRDMLTHWMPLPEPPQQ